MQPQQAAPAEAIKSEEQRQCDALTLALTATIQKYGRELREDKRAPQINAVLGALASAAGSVLCSIEKPAHRRTMRQTFDRAVTRAASAGENRLGIKVEIAQEPPRKTRARA